jgi:integrase
MTVSRNLRKRGLTVNVKQVSEQDRARRKKPWRVRWNKYFPGLPQRKQRSEYFVTEEKALEFKARLEQLWRDKPPERHPALDLLPGTVAEFYHQEWRPKYLEQGEVSAATCDGYHSVFTNHIAPDPISAMQLTAIVPADLIDFHQRMRARSTGLPTRRHAHFTLSALFFYAKCRGRLPAGDNPCKEMSKRMRTKNELAAEPEPHPFSMEDAPRLLAHLAAHEPDAYPYLLFLHDEGCRPGEASALKWDKIDLQNATAVIDESFSPNLYRRRLQKGPWPASGDKDTKTHQKREIELTDLVVTVLRKLRQEQRARALKRGWKQPVYVFTTARDGVQLRQNGHVNTVLKRALDALDLDRTQYSLYSLRDTFATSHLVDHWERLLPAVSRQLGHKNPETTRRHYYKFQPTLRTRGFVNEIRHRGLR